MSIQDINFAPNSPYNAALFPESRDACSASRYLKINETAKKVGQIALPIIKASACLFTIYKGPVPFSLGFIYGVVSRPAEKEHINEFKRFWNMEKVQSKPLKILAHVAFAALSISALALSFSFRHLTLPLAFMFAGAESAQVFKDYFSGPPSEELS